MQILNRKVGLFNSDRAIENSDEDELGRKEFALRIANVIINRNEPESIVIGIDAPWGNGKTSVLNMIIERLEKYRLDKTKALLGDKISVIKFNPWRFTEEEELLKNFYNSLAEKIQISIENKIEKLSKIAKSKSKVFELLDAFEINVGGIGVKYKISDAVKSLGELKPEIDLEEIKKRLGNFFEETEYKIVVIMDDIDRLDKEEMHAVFRLVKLSADIPNVSYILSFDSDRVAEALEDKYGSKNSGKAFLEKIIQVHLPLPPASPLRLLPITVKGIQSALFTSEVRLTEGESIIFQDLFYRAFENRITNPRLSNRLANSLSFALPLVKGEVNNLDFILIESIKVYYPTLYDSIKENIVLFTPPSSINRIFDFEERDETLKNELEELLIDFLKDIPRRYEKGAKELIQYLFPKTENFLKAYNRYADYISQKDNVKRISMEEYFPRYFNYSIEPNDISDNEVNKFLEQIADTSLEKIAVRINEIVKDSSEIPVAFLKKLIYFADGLQPEIKQTLAMAISLAANSFPDSHPDDKQYGVGALIQSVNLTRSLISNLPMRKKEDITRDIIAKTPSTMFAYNFIESIKPLNSESSFVGETFFAKLKDNVAAKIRYDALETPLEVTYGIQAQDLYLFWYENDLRSLRNYAEERIESNPEEITALLAGILKTSIDPDKPYKFTFMRGSDFYKITTDILKESRIIDVIKKIFGHIEEKDFKNEGKERVAKMFVTEFKRRNNQNLIKPQETQYESNEFGFN